MLTYKRLSIEVVCDLCKIMYVYEEGTDYAYRDDVPNLLDFEGWSSKWHKSEAKYYHYCKDCLKTQKKKFETLKAEVKSGLYSVSESKYLDEIIKK